VGDFPLHEGEIELTRLEQGTFSVEPLVFRVCTSIEGSTSLMVWATASP
jgi:hypothetical protein